MMKHLALRLLAAAGLLAVLLGCARPGSSRDADATVVALRGTRPVPARGLHLDPVVGFRAGEDLATVAKRHFTDAAYIGPEAVAYDNRRGDRVVFGLVLVDREAEWRAQRAADGTLERELARAQEELDRCLATCEEDGCNECALDVPHGVRAYLGRFSEWKGRAPILDAYLPLGESDEYIELRALRLADVDRDAEREIVVEYADAEPPECTYAIVHYELAVLGADSLEGVVHIDIGDDGHGGDGAPDRTAIHRFRDEDGDGDLDLVVRIAAHLPYHCSARPDGWPDGRPVRDDSYLDWDREDCRFSVSRHVYLYDAESDRYEGAPSADPVVITDR